MIRLSESAEKEVKRLLEPQGPEAFVRVGVRGGGCSGLSYDIKFDKTRVADDREFEFHGVKIVSDPKSLLYLDNMTIDFSSDLVGGGFKFVNPNASGTCGCGTSFSV